MRSLPGARRAEGDNSGGQQTTYRFTGQRFGPGGGGLYYYGARWYDSTIGRFIQADSIVPNPGNPQSLNRYTYVRNNPIRLVDPSGMAECAAGDTACWQSEWEWKNRWYQQHGYENAGNNRYVYTGKYVFSDLGAIMELLQDVATGRSPLPAPFGGVSFTYRTDQFSLSLEPRGVDNKESYKWGAFATGADMLDLGLTGLCTFAYVLEQSAAAATGPGAGIGLLGGQIAYSLFQPGLFVIDSFALYSIFKADVAAGRTGYDPVNREAALGVDTIISAFTFGMSSVNQTVVPGMFVSGAFDTLQVSYDLMRATGAWSGYSYVFRW